MLRSDTEHRRANANAGIERDDFVVLQFLAEAVDEVDFGADGPLSAGGRSPDGFFDGLRRTQLIVGPLVFGAALWLAEGAEGPRPSAGQLVVLRPRTLVADVKGRSSG